MPARRELTTRQIRHMLRLARDGVSARQIGRTLGIARSTVQDNLGRAAPAGLVSPLGKEITDAIFKQRLFSHVGGSRAFAGVLSQTGRRWLARCAGTESTPWCPGRSFELSKDELIQLVLKL